MSDLEAALAGAEAAWNLDGLRAAPLCDHCLGRLAAKRGKGTNADRGRLMRPRVQVDSAPCGVCAGLFDSLDVLARLAADALGAYEFSTFSIGTRVDPAIAIAEETAWQRAGVTEQETVKAELNREIGKRVEALTGKPADTKRPHVTAIVDTQFHMVDLTVAPVYFRGRYRKLSREIPQTRWPCRVCGGRGCARCGGTGKMYPTSVEEIVAAPLMAALGGESHALHGMGREDIDARMLGRGRPFVIEIASPRRRTADTAAAVAVIRASGSVEVDALEPCAPDLVQRLKEDRADKTYAVTVSGSSIEEGKVQEGLAALLAAPIEQRTPARVSHRRADAVRVRHVRSARLTSCDGAGFTLEVTAEAGTYIKELVHGDGGRTRPSLAGLLGVPLAVLALDVLEVHTEEEPW